MSALNESDPASVSTGGLPGEQPGTFAPEIQDALEPAPETEPHPLDRARDVLGIAGEVVSFLAMEYPAVDEDMAIEVLRIAAKAIAGADGLERLGISAAQRSSRLLHQPDARSEAEVRRDCLNMVQEISRGYGAPHEMDFLHGLAARMAGFVLADRPRATERIRCLEAALALTCLVRADGAEGIVRRAIANAERDLAFVAASTPLAPVPTEAP